MQSKVHVYDETSPANWEPEWEYLADQKFWLDMVWAWAFALVWVLPTQIFCQGLGQDLLLRNLMWSTFTLSVCNKALEKIEGDTGRVRRGLTVMFCTLPVAALWLFILTPVMSTAMGFFLCAFLLIFGSGPTVRREKLTLAAILFAFGVAGCYPASPWMHELLSDFAAYTPPIPVF